jgi:hypothetical protein
LASDSLYTGEINEIMSFTKWYGGLLKKMKWYDIGMIKLSVAAFTILVAKFYPEIISADWTVYGAITILAAAPVIYHVLKK